MELDPSYYPIRFSDGGYVPQDMLKKPVVKRMALIRGALHVLNTQEAKDWPNWDITPTYMEKYLLDTYAIMNMYYSEGKYAEAHLVSETAWEEIEEVGRYLRFAKHWTKKQVFKKGRLVDTKVEV